MNASFVKVLFVATLALSGGLCWGGSAAWVDEVVSFSQPDGSSMAGGPPSAALGAQDSLFVSVDTPEVLILAFTDNRVFDGPGDDLWIYSAGNSDATVEVRARSFDGPCTLLGTLTGNGGFDLADAGLAYVDYIRFVGLDDNGEYPGYDLDAVLALNSIDRNSACAIPAPAAVILTGLGTLLIAAVRRRKMLA
ncbi:MAG: hypothetical protein ACM3VT_21770 [Solirubrobacterales bacterium]